MTPILCTVRPISTYEGFVPARPFRGMIALYKYDAGPARYGLSVTGEIDFDLAEDRRVTGIDFSVRVGGSLLSERVARKLAGGAFSSLFIHQPTGALSAEEAQLKLQHRGMDAVCWTFGAPNAPTRYWLGGGAFVDIEKGVMTGIGIQFQT
jgi:hypothetical protein